MISLTPSSIREQYLTDEDRIAIAELELRVIRKLEDDWKGQGSIRVGIGVGMKKIIMEAVIASLFVAGWHAYCDLRKVLGKDGVEHALVISAVPPYLQV